MVINHNMSAINSHRVIKFKNWDLDKNVEKLSSGMRINRAGDDASGLAVSEKMRSQIRGLRQATRNTEDGISLIQTAEGYLGESHAILQRIRELAVQAANGVYTSEDRMQIQVEVSALIDEIDRIASHAQFNEMNLLTGRFARETGENRVTASMWFHIGANMDQRERVYIGTMNSQGLGLKNPVGNPETASFISISTISKANATIGTIDQALKKLSKQRADLGAYQNRLEHAAKGLMSGYENLQAAESRIRDTDMAEEMSDFVKNQILQQ
ncbi:MAG TPA: flagellin, partial [Spirochaetota bacterium]|nr:flagellin [Spirochaetota bacterium]